MKKAVDARDVAALGAALTQSAQFAPDPTWNEGETGWRAIAEAGATKAAANDFAGARASCKACHRAWRDRYQHEFRERPVPTAAEAAAPGAPGAPGTQGISGLGQIGHPRSSGEAVQGVGGPGLGATGPAGS